MQRAAEISAQVFTARDAILRDTPEDLRVGYLLFDSAIETLMVRQIQYLSAYLFHSESHDWIPSHLKVKPDLSDTTQIHSEEAKAGEGNYIHWTFSKTQIGKIEKDFSEKLRFLAWNGDIPSEYVRGISRLHEYRNEMYHREVIRPAALKIVAHLYASITAEFLDLLRPNSYAWSSASDGTVARIYERMNMEVPVGGLGFGRGFELQAAMATALRRDLILDDVPLLIAEYIESRVSNAHELVDHVRDFLAPMRGKDFSEMDTIRMAYDNPALAVGPPTRAQFKRWDMWANGTRRLADALTAFHSLADFEAEFEEFEKIFEELAFQVDEEVDRQIDDAKLRRAE